MLGNGAWYTWDRGLQARELDVEGKAVGLSCGWMGGGWERDPKWCHANCHEASFPGERKTGTAHVGETRHQEKPNDNNHENYIWWLPHNQDHFDMWSVG